MGLQVFVNSICLRVHFPASNPTSALLLHLWKDAYKNDSSPLTNLRQVPNQIKEKKCEKSGRYSQESRTFVASDVSKGGAKKLQLYLRKLNTLLKLRLPLRKFLDPVTFVVFRKNNKLKNQKDFLNN